MLITKGLSPRRRGTAAERLIERAIFGSRWLLVPFHFGLLLATVILLVKFAQVAFITLTNAFLLDGKEVIVASLSLIELVLIANLLLMVIFSSYEGFVSRLDEHGEAQENLVWRGRVGFGILKLRIMTSITAISGVFLLEKVIEADKTHSHEIAWAALAFALFVIANLVLALMERFSQRDS